MPALTAPTLPSAPTVTAAEVEAGFAICTGQTQTARAAILAWFEAATEALLRSHAATPYNDPDAETKNADLLAALDTLKTALS